MFCPCTLIWHSRFLRISQCSRAETLCFGPSLTRSRNSFGSCYILYLLTQIFTKKWRQFSWFLERITFLNTSLILHVFLNELWYTVIYLFRCGDKQAFFYILNHFGENRYLTQNYFWLPWYFYWAFKVLYATSSKYLLDGSKCGGKPLSNFPSTLCKLLALWPIKICFALSLFVFLVSHWLNLFLCPAPVVQ